MTCEHVNDILFAYLDGQCPPVVHEAIQAHLVECAACQQLVESTRRLEAGLQEVYGQEVAPPDLWRRIMASIAAQESSTSWVARVCQRLWTTPAYRVAAASVVLVLLCLSVWWGMSNRTMVPVVVAPVHDFIAYQRRGGGRLQDLHAALARLGREPRAHEAVMATLPRFTAAGYQLVGSRLCTFLDRELTALMYRKGERFLSLYIMPGSGLALPEGNW